MKEILIDTSLDVLKMLPYLFAAFMLIEVLEKYSGAFTEKILLKVGRAGPVAGALLGCIPQCGFCVVAANLYTGGIISTGTLLSVFIATSDEAVLILLGNPDAVAAIGPLLAAKVVIAVLAGYLTDLFLARWITGVELFGIEQLSAFLLGDTIFQPVIAAVIGLIPNCAASVILTQLYLGKAITFASVTAGLCTGAGVGLAVLCRVNHDKMENLKIILTLFGFGVAAGLIL